MWLGGSSRGAIRVPAGAGNGQPLRPICKNLLGALAQALGHVLTLCHRSRASAWPTQTHTPLGSLGEQEKEPGDNRKTNRPEGPLRFGVPGGHCPPIKQGVLTHGAGLPFRPGVLGTLTVPHTCASWGSMYPPGLWLSYFSRFLSISHLPDSGLSMGRKSKKGPKNQRCGIHYGTGQRLPPLT